LVLCGEVDKGTKFLLIDSTQEYAIEFDLGEASIECRAEASKEVVEGASGNFSVELGLEGVEAEVNRIDPCLLKLTGDGSESSAVGR
jgi:hypothetical protein